MYRDQLLALMVRWKFGAGAAAILSHLPEARRDRVLAACEAIPQEKAQERLGKLIEREQRRITRWGERRFGNAWNHLDPQVRKRLVQENGRNH